MAVKKDANGDPLCASCLDARQAKRRAEFLLHQGRAPLPEAPAAAAPPQRKKVEFLRIVRSAPEAAASARAPASAPAARAERAPAKAATPRAPERQAPESPRKAPANQRELARKFVMLAAELGFLRAQELLDELQSVVGRGRR